MKNESLYPWIADMLGVELGEEFEIEDKLFCEDFVFRLTEFGLDYKQPDDEYWRSGDFAHHRMCDLLGGCSKIIKLPFRPRLNDEFWKPVVSIDAEVAKVGGDVWIGSTCDLALLALGMVYRTKEDAEAHLAEDYKRLTGKEFKQ